MAPEVSKGLTAVGIFLVFGSSMALLAGITLAFPGTPLDRVWALNPLAHAQMLPMGRLVGVLFVLLAAILGVAAMGWLRRRFWGWVLAVVIIATQVLGDCVNLARGDFLRGAAGAVIASCLLAYPLSPRVRQAFPRNTLNNLC